MKSFHFEITNMHGFDEADNDMIGRVLIVRIFALQFEFCVMTRRPAK